MEDPNDKTEDYDGRQKEQPAAKFLEGDWMRRSNPHEALNMAFWP